MHGIVGRTGFEMDSVGLRERPLGELWQMWRQVGHAMLVRAWDEGHVWRDRARSRRTMILLTEHELRDMGLTRQQAAFEMNKPFWKS